MSNFGKVETFGDINKGQNVFLETTASKSWEEISMSTPISEYKELYLEEISYCVEKGKKK